MIVGGVTLFAEVAQSVHCGCLVRCQSLAVGSLTHGGVDENHGFRFLLSGGRFFHFIRRIWPIIRKCKKVDVEILEGNLGKHHATPCFNQP